MQLFDENDNFEREFPRLHRGRIDSANSGKYDFKPDGIYLIHPQSGHQPTRLCNFTATITEDVTCGDDTGGNREYQLCVTLLGQQKTITVPAGQFESLKWKVELLGPQAIIEPVAIARRHIPIAIQEHSGRIEQIQLLSQTGWHKVAGQWVFVDATGGIGRNGRVSGVRSNLPSQLRMVQLDPNASGSSLHQAVQSVLKILNLGPPSEVVVPMFAAAWRAVLGPTDFSLHVAGQTGQGKTELMALIQQHFGAGFDARNLPGSWSSTENSLEYSLNRAKDIVFGIDDFVAGQSSGEAQQLQRKAERVFRGKGNSAGRSRMSGGRQPAAHPPLGLVISTGEDTPRGHSIQARMLVLELPTKTLDWVKLTECQNDAEAGLYAKAMAAFIQWLAPRFEGIGDRISKQSQALCDNLTSDIGHRRTPRIVADLAVGLQFFLMFAVNVGAVTDERSDRLFAEWWDVLQKVSSRQNQTQSESDPVDRFIELLKTSITTGKAHVADGKNCAPPDAQTWGWKPGSAASPWKPSGQLVGWIVGEDLYLDPDTSYKAAVSAAASSMSSISIPHQTLIKRLNDRGLLKSTEPDSQTLRVRKMLAGKRVRVLHLAASVIRGDTEPGLTSET